VKLGEPFGVVCGGDDGVKEALSVIGEKIKELLEEN